MNALIPASLCALGFAATTFAAAQPVKEFPEGAAPLPATALQQRLAGRKFLVKPADGNDLRLEFKDDGFLFINTKSGANVSGKWRAEDGKLCTNVRNDAVCQEFRGLGERMFLKRVSGEVVEYLAP